MIPLFPYLTSLVYVHSSSPNIFPSSSMGQIGQTTLLPYVGSMELPISSIFHSAEALTSSNITNLVTIKLNSVEDYLTWYTQFTSLLLSNELVRFVDGCFSTLPQFECDASSNQQVNHHYPEARIIKNLLASYLTFWVKYLLRNFALR